MIDPPDAVAVDTNILLSLIRPDEIQRSQAQAALAALREASARLVVMPQVVAEFWSVATRPKAARNGLGLSAVRMGQAVIDLENRFELLPDLPGAYALWKDFVVRYGVIGASVHDARLAAAMIAHRVPRLLTFDAGDFARYEEIAVLDPASSS